MSTEDQENPYVVCVRKQLEEIDLLSSIYCSPGEMHIMDCTVISDFNDFLQSQQTDESALKSHLDFTIQLTCGEAELKLEARIELPYLYPLLENAIVVVHSGALSKTKERYINEELEKYIAGVEKGECYVFQVLSWLQDFLGDVHASGCDAEEPAARTDPDRAVDFERLWVYTHHMKAKSKRLEVLRQARILQLSGFSRPGKPGIICVEGVHRNTQEFWRTIKSLNWHKIQVCKSERSRVADGNVDQKRRFDGFKEQLFCDNEGADESEEAVMSMAMFVKFLESHRSGYMKKELFGFD